MAGWAQMGEQAGLRCLAYKARWILRLLDQPVHLVRAAQDCSIKGRAIPRRAHKDAADSGHGGAQTNTPE